MKRDRISFVAKTAKWGTIKENRRCIIIPLDEVPDVRTNFDNIQIKITLEKLKL